MNQEVAMFISLKSSKKQKRIHRDAGDELIPKNCDEDTAQLVKSSKAKNYGGFIVM